MLKLKFWKKAKPVQPEELTEKMRSHLTEKYGLDPGYVGTLRCVSKNDWHVGKRVDLIRIFDPGLVRTGGPTVNSYDSLMNYRTAIMFEGRIEEDQPRLLDRRTSKGR